jgi:hypothetical protein
MEGHAMKIKCFFMAWLLFFTISLASAQNSSFYKLWNSPAWWANANIQDVLNEYKKAFNDLYDQIDKLRESSGDSGSVSALIQDSLDFQKSFHALSYKVENLEIQIIDLSNRLDKLEAKISK